MVNRRGGPFIEVKGAAQVRKVLRASKRDLADMKDANYEAAEVVAKKARFLVPVKTGRLKGSIRSSRAAKSAEVRAGRASVPYAGPIHFGWPTRPNPARGWRGGPISPQPFLYDAADDRIDEVIDTYERAVARIIAKHDLD